MARESIPYWVYFLAGAVMIILSLVVDSQTGQSKLRMFVYAGIVFLLVGIVKYFLSKAVPKRKAHPAQAQHSHQRVHPHAQQPAYRPHIKMHHAHQGTKVCHKCRAKLHPRFRYCPGCGAKV
ncbi:MAG: hypothetical protein ACE5DM_02780 [Candidatus Nanoarchaeia archaeon]